MPQHGLEFVRMGHQPHLHPLVPIKDKSPCPQPDQHGMIEELTHTLKGADFTSHHHVIAVTASINTLPLLLDCQSWETTMMMISITDKMSGTLPMIQQATPTVVIGLLVDIRIKVISTGTGSNILMIVNSIHSIACIQVNTPEHHSLMAEPDHQTLGPQPTIPDLVREDPHEFARLKLALVNVLPFNAREHFNFHL
ncbi:hypothetical protein GOODEAATRI_002941 [Goodea atripinnis]|uniref:Uncharacterized protein n=1 Tax=Goodea atripinnis TaxID=208336 RepID=A0ABV0MZP4_9TELE